MSARGQVTPDDAGGAAILPDEDMAEMVNLTRPDTGVAGTIFVSTALGAHGPRVKWYPGRVARDAPCLVVTLEAAPRVLNHGLARREYAAVEPELLAWVAQNRAALLEFWQDGLGWTRAEVNAFLDGLAKRP